MGGAIENRGIQKIKKTQKKDKKKKTKTKKSEKKEHTFQLIKKTPFMTELA